MKKMLVAALLAIAGSAFANGYASLEYYDETNRATDATNIKEALIVGIKDGSMDYSIKMENSQTDFGKGSISQGLEYRMKKSFDGFYLGGRLGEKVTSTTHFSHYAIDAGVKIPLGYGLVADVGGRYRNAFDTSNKFKTTRAHLAIGYSLTKQDSVSLRKSRSWGDEEKDAWRLQYTRAF